MDYLNKATTRLLALSTLSWIITIAIFRDFTYDESWSYLSGTANSIIDIIQYKGYVHANNHVYNSIFFHIIGQFDAPRIAFRSISVACFCIYLKQVYRISNITQTNRLFLVCICCVAPYIQYFALGRGYALSLTSFILGYRLLLENKQTQQASIAFGFSLFFSSTAIFSFSYGAIALWLLWIFQNRKSPRKPHVIIYPTILLIAAITYVYHSGEIIIQNDPYIPKSNNLLKNGLISSLVSYQTGGVFPIDSQSFSLLRIIQLSSALVVITLQVTSYLRKKANKHVITTVFLLSLILLGFFSSHVLLGTPYPLGRAVIFMLPLFYLLYVDALRIFNPSVRITFLLILTAPIVFSKVQSLRDIIHPSIEQLLSENDSMEVAFIGTKPTPWISAPIARTTQEVNYRKYGTVSEFLQEANPPHVVIANSDSLHLFPTSYEHAIEMQGGYIWIKMPLPDQKLND